MIALQFINLGRFLKWSIKMNYKLELKVGRILFNILFWGFLIGSWFFVISPTLESLGINSSEVLIKLVSFN